MTSQGSSRSHDLPAICCVDTNVLIELANANLLDKLRKFAQDGFLRIPRGVYNEARKSQRLRTRLDRWRRYRIVIEPDNTWLQFLPEIERKYGHEFHFGGTTYAGFFRKPSNRKAADGQLVALAKARNLLVVSNDVSIHGACLLEDIYCERWEYLVRRLREWY